MENEGQYGLGTPGTVPARNESGCNWPSRCSALHSAADDAAVGKCRINLLIVHSGFFNEVPAAFAVKLSDVEHNETRLPMRAAFAACHEPAAGRTLRATRSYRPLKGNLWNPVLYLSA